MWFEKPSQGFRIIATVKDEESRTENPQALVQKSSRGCIGALGEESFCSPVPSGLTTINALSFVPDERRNANRFPSGENVTALSAPERMPSLYNPRATAAETRTTAAIPPAPSGFENPVMGDCRAVQW